MSADPAGAIHTPHPRNHMSPNKRLNGIGRFDGQVFEKKENCDIFSKRSFWPTRQQRQINCVFLEMTCHHTLQNDDCCL